MERTSQILDTGRAPAVRPGDGIAGLLAGYAPIGLEQMDAVALQNRTDTKYLLDTRQLARTLAALAGQYRVLAVDGVRLSPYQTVYFDTPGFALYLQHHAGKRNRYKVRSRRYVVTDQSFLEVKLKTSKDRTVKRRVPIDTLATSCTPALARFVAAQVQTPAGGLEPKLWNEFSRITLVSTSRAERLTIDLDLRFGHAGGCVALPGVAVAEVKQVGFDRCSGFVQQMHAASIQPTGFSKYCIGVSLLYPHIKHNMFKSKLQLVQKLMGDTNDY